MHNLTYSSVKNIQQKLCLFFQERLTSEKHKTVTLEKMITGKSMSHVGSLDQRPGALVKRYGELYSQMRLETLDALDKLPELVNSEELKNKLLFSVVVVSTLFKFIQFSRIKNFFFFQLAFRSVTSSISTKREQIRRILQLPPPPPSSEVGTAPTMAGSVSTSGNPAARDMEDAITSYLRRATENFDLSKNVEVKMISSLVRISVW